MSKKSNLRNVLAIINKPKIISKEQTFTPPIPSPASLIDTQGKQTQGNLPHGQLPYPETVETITILGDPSLELQSVTQGNLPQGELPQVETTQGQSTQGALGQEETSRTGRASDSDEAASGIPNDYVIEQDFDFDQYHDDRSKKRRKKIVNEALQVHFQLSPASQQYLLDQYQGSGWGRLVHCITRHLKAPSRHGLKLVDTALIIAVYDRTVAPVNPSMFAPINIDEFEEDTGMDGSNIRAALKSLVSRTILIKLTWKSVNFWGLNLSYFSASDRSLFEGKQPQGKRPQGRSPQGNAPCDKKGNSPNSAGQTTPSDNASRSRNYYQTSSPKNLNQESEKESLSSVSFPSDMIARWTSLEHSGKSQKAKKEREIFQTLFSEYGNPFFENCGKVVTFLEERGNGKSGEEGKIHSPMVWMDGHWELNFSRFQNWTSKQEALRESQALKAQQETQKKIQAEQQAQAQNKETEERAKRQAKMEADTQRFLAAYPSESEVNAFVEKAIQLSGCQFTRNSWRSSGWESPLVQSCAISHFLEIESQEFSRKVDHNQFALSEVTA